MPAAIVPAVDDDKWEARIRLFAGLYDPPSASSLEAALDSLPPRGGRVRLLNPTPVDEDAIARRFALLEID